MAEPQAGLEALRPLHAEGPGLLADPLLWLAIGTGLILAVVLAAVAQRGFFKTRALRQEALRELRLASNLPADEALRAQAMLLRRIARTVGGEATMQHRGEAWLAALDSIFGTRFFTQGAGRCFGEALYATGAPDVIAVQCGLEALIARLRWPR